MAGPPLFVIPGLVPGIHAHRAILTGRRSWMAVRATTKFTKITKSD